MVKVQYKTKQKEDGMRIYVGAAFRTERLLERFMRIMQTMEEDLGYEVTVTEVREDLY